MGRDRVNHEPAGVEREGVIKFALRHRTAVVRVGPATQRALVELLAWRQRFVALGVLGADPLRYGGAGFGNVSTRLGAGPSFLVTATQTGGLPRLDASDIVEVANWDFAANRLHSFGDKAPSSEALTHAAIYAACPRARFVFHVHAPALWRARCRLGLLETPLVAYGTPAMATALSTLCRGDAHPGALIAMPGHEDGLIVYGRSASEAGEAIVAALNALRVSGRPA